MLRSPDNLKLTVLHFKKRSGGAVQRCRLTKRELQVSSVGERRKTRSLEEMAQPHPLDRPARDQQPEAEERHAEDHAGCREREEVRQAKQRERRRGIAPIGNMKPRQPRLKFMP
jgi:hypothetical protein